MSTELQDMGAKTRCERLYKLLHAAFHVADDCEENAQTGAVTYLGGATGTNDLGDMGSAFFDLGLESHEDIREFCNSFASITEQNERMRGALEPEDLAEFADFLAHRGNQRAREYGLNDEEFLRLRNQIERVRAALKSVAP